VASCTQVLRTAENKAPYNFNKGISFKVSTKYKNTSTPFNCRAANTVICADFPLIHAVGGHVVVYYLTVGLLVLLDVVEIIPHIFITELKGCSII